MIDFLLFYVILGLIFAFLFDELDIPLTRVERFIFGPLIIIVIVFAIVMIILLFLFLILIALLEGLFNK